MHYNALPAYPGLKPVAWFPDGAGLEDDIPAAGTADMSYIGIADDTDETGFLSYVSVLEADGFVCSWQRDAAAGLYREMTKDGAVVYLYYVPSEHRTRIVVDNASLPLADFAGRPEYEVINVLYDCVSNGLPYDPGRKAEFRILDAPGMK